jgi:tetratricopeptide (TPR) repeat protein
MPAVSRIRRAAFQRPDFLCVDRGIAGPLFREAQGKEKEKGMKRKPCVFGCLLAAALVFSGAGCSKLKARDLLNRGVQAYKDGQFDTAIEDFKQAKDLDPHLMNARLYLATAYATQYIPGAPSDDNNRLGQQAIQEFQEVLQVDPNNLSAIDGIGSLLYNMGANPFDPKVLDQSKSYHEKHIQLKPDDPESYYWIGVIDWTLAFKGNKDLRADYNGKAKPKKQVKDVDPMPDALRAEFADKYGPLIQEGIQNLQKAIEIRPDYDDAMAYLNLIYRQKADLESDPSARDNDLKLADELVDKVKEIKQKKMEQPSAQPAS